MIYRSARWLGRKFTPSLWHRLVLWRSARVERRWWAGRAVLVESCPDNDRLPRVPEAGRVVGGYQIMHNGIKILADSFYGEDGTRLIAANRGCHEPQEEVAFAAVLALMPAGAVMVELGAYWGFYSLWFSQEVVDARVFLVEPDPANLAMGQQNFQINGRRGDFTQAYVGSREGVAEDGTAMISVESFVAQKALTHIGMLHADIQGFELAMLDGTGILLQQHQIDYLFISTHSMELHRQCADFLSRFGYRILVSIDLEGSYSFDGILVACSPLVTPPEFSHPAKRPRNEI